MEGVVPRRRDCLGESRDLEGGRSMSPRGGGGGGGRRKWTRHLGRTRLWCSRFSDTVGSVMGTQARAREGRWDTSYINAGVAAANQREGYNGRRGYGDKTTFGRTRSGRHKYAKASRRRELKGAVRLLDQNDELVR